MRKSGISNIISVVAARCRRRIGLIRADARLLYRGHTLMYSIRLTGAAREIDRLRFPKDVAFQTNVTISLAPNTSSTFEVGENCYIGDGCFFSVYEKIRLGSNVIIGAYSYVTSAIHNMDDIELTVTEQGFSGKAVELCDGVWLGTGVVVLPGVTIGSGSVIGAGSVVTKDVPAMQVWAGVPAKYIRSRVPLSNGSKSA